MEQKVGSRNASIVLMRASEGFAIVSPEVKLQDLNPALETNEAFRLDARAYVGK